MNKCRDLEKSIVIIEFDGSVEMGEIKWYVEVL